MKTKNVVAEEGDMVKRIGLYIRVSTQRQAAIPEGSLKNQRQLLEECVRSKNETAARMAKSLGESAKRWEVTEVYVEEARSATETSRRPEYQRMVSDVERGRIDIVLCLALTRISRSVRDFLELVDLLHKHDVDFISLKEDFDSTTPQGRCFMVILLALAQFEAEIDSQRVTDSIRARSERGLWVAGQVLGYDLDPKRPGYLLVNKREAKVVNIGFDKYLELGSTPKVVEALNRLGFTTKEYTSRRGSVHKGRPFTFSTVHNMLCNRAYLGEREIGKRSLDHKTKRGKKHQVPYRIVPGVWEPIVGREKFEKVQRLMAENEKTGHNGVTKPKHLFLFNGGLLYCDKCGAEMAGAAGTSKTKQVYHYYRCSNKDCGFRVPASEVEDLVKWRLKHLCRDHRKLEALVEMTNVRLRAELPRIHEQRDALRKELEQINALTAGIMDRFVKVMTGDAERLVQERLDELAQRRGRVQDGLEALELMAREIENDLVEKAVVQQALVAFDEVFEEAPPYLKKQFVKAIIGQVRLSDLRLALGLDGRPGADLVAPKKATPGGLTAPAGAGSLGVGTGGEGRIQTVRPFPSPLFQAPKKSNIFYLLLKSPGP